MSKKFLCVFCGSSNNVDERYFNVAKKMANKMLEKNIGLVYGGASVGLMGAIADRMLENGGEVIGVMPQGLVDMEVAHDNLTELIVVDTMHSRKEIMYQRSDAFVALPGGFGTLDELFEILTWRQLNFHHKPISVLSIDQYFKPIEEFVKNANRVGFVKDRDVAFIGFTESLDDVIATLDK
jgi:uncharacterized protein (TIGR00730 family)